MWKQIKQPEDPDWVEWHTQQMTYRYGRVMLKVWQSMAGYFMASVTKPNGDRSIKGLESTDINAAKDEAIKWVSFDV